MLIHKNQIFLKYNLSFKFFSASWIQHKFRKELEVRFFKNFDIFEILLRNLYLYSFSFKFRTELLEQECLLGEKGEFLKPFERARSSTG